MFGLFSCGVFQFIISFYYVVVYFEVGYIVYVWFGYGFVNQYSGIIFNFVFQFGIIIKQCWWMIGGVGVYIVYEVYDLVVVYIIFRGIVKNWEYFLFGNGNLEFFCQFFFCQRAGVKEFFYQIFIVFGGGFYQGIVQFYGMVYFFGWDGFFFGFIFIF